MSKSHVASQASEPTPAQFKELFSQIQQGRVTKERLQTFLRGQEPAFPSNLVTVDHGRSVEQLVKDGRYDYSSSDITGRHFPSSGKGKVKVEIFLANFDTRISSEAILQEADKLSLRRPTVKEGLALGAQYPDLQREGPITILCEPWRNPSGDLDVPCLYRNGSDRNLDLGWWDGDWRSSWRFVLVRK